MTNIPSVGGQATKGETFAKLLHHLREAQDMCAVLSHLHNTEGEADKLHAQGWMAVQELIKRMVIQVTKLAMKGMH